MALAQDHLDAFTVCYTKAVDRLQRVRHTYTLLFSSVLIDSYSLLLNTSIQPHMPTIRFHHLGCK